MGESTDLARQAHALGVMTVPLSPAIGASWAEGTAAAQDLFDAPRPIKERCAQPSHDPRANGWTGGCPSGMEAWQVGLQPDSATALGWAGGAAGPMPAALGFHHHCLRPLHQGLFVLANDVLLSLCAQLGWSRADQERLAATGDRVLRVTWYPELSLAGGDWPHLVRTHRDASLVTLLPEPQGAGLEFEARDGTWWTVEPAPGHALVVVGQLMSAASGGRCWAPRHRMREGRVHGGPGAVLLPLFVLPPLRARLGVGPFASAHATPTAEAVLDSWAASVFTDRLKPEPPPEERPPALSLLEWR